MEEENVKIKLLDLAEKGKPNVTAQAPFNFLRQDSFRMAGETTNPQLTVIRFFSALLAVYYRYSLPKDSSVLHLQFHCIIGKIDHAADEVRSFDDSVAQGSRGVPSWVTSAND